LLTLVLEYLRFVSGYQWLPDLIRRIAANRMIIYSLILIALMLLRPQGLFGMLPRRASERKIGPVQPGPKLKGAS